IRADIRGPEDRDHLLASLGILLAHDGVGSVGKRRARKDTGALAGPNGPGRDAPGRYLLDDAKPHGRLGRGALEIGAPRGIPVHGGIGPGGNVERAYHVGREDTVQCVVQRNAKRWLSPHRRENPPRRVGSGERGIAHTTWARSHARFTSVWSQLVSP